MIEDLIERLEEAKAGSRELDAHVMAAVENREIYRQELMGADHLIARHREPPKDACTLGRYYLSGFIAQDCVPLYTKDLQDAYALARRLFPCASIQMVEAGNGNGTFGVVVAPGIYAKAQHKSLPLALTAAVLKAHRQRV